MLAEAAVQELSSTMIQYRMKEKDPRHTMRQRQVSGQSGVDNGKSIAALNIQLRVACIDGQIHAVRHFLELGAEPFRIVCINTCIQTHVSVLGMRNAPAFND